MSKEQEVLKKLERIIDPDLGKDIVTLGFVKDMTIADDGKVSFKLELTTPACPVKDQFRAQAEEAVGELDWVTGVAVEMTASKRKSAFSKVGEGLSKVQHIVAVSSCKGGVGKSTNAVNLAFALKAQGAKVGIFDADVYGPSLPTMVDVGDFPGVYQEDDLIVPLEQHGIKLMSFGFFSGEAGSGPAIMRGPRVSNVINQLVTGTNWGELDYLVIDMPPGTGDIQLTLCQLLPLTAAIIVTTPQEISFVDVVKGIQMFDVLKVPTIAVIENMSYFICDSCETRHDIFGEGAMRRLVEQFGIRNSFEIPMVGDIARQSDVGVPIVFSDPVGMIAGRYGEIAEAVVREVSKVVHGGITQPEVSFVPGKGIVYETSEQQLTVPAAELRRACRCAFCVDENTGQQILDPTSVAEDVHPLSMEPMGNYAVRVDWSDGHHSIYPFAKVEELG